MPFLRSELGLRPSPSQQWLLYLRHAHAADIMAPTSLVHDGGQMSGLPVSAILAAGLADRSGAGSTSPTWNPARAVRPWSVEASIIAAAPRTARAGWSKVMTKPSAVVCSSCPPQRSISASPDESSEGQGTPHR